MICLDSILGMAYNYIAKEKSKFPVPYQDSVKFPVYNTFLYVSTHLLNFFRIGKTVREILHYPSVSTVHLASIPGR